jgi:hypothetical protein
MNKPEKMETLEQADHVAPRQRDHEAERTPTARDKVPGRPGTRRLGFAALLLLLGALAFGAWQHWAQHIEVMAAAEQRRDFVPSVLVAPVRSSAPTMSVSWPGTTEAFAAANIYARASAYIAKRNVDIGSHVKEGQVLAEITAPELDHQIAQAEATLAQMQAAQRQAQANKDLANVTWGARQPAGRQGLGDGPTGHHRRPDPQGSRRRSRRRGREYQSAASATFGPASAEGLSERPGTIRRRRHAAQHRCRQPGASRRD